MRIMVKQANNRVGTVKLPDGHYTQSGRETFLELCTVHFPDFRLTDCSMDGQGQSDLGERTRRTNRADWNLVRRMIDQSRIKWAINSFSSFKSARTDCIVPALLQNLALHLCRIFRACLAYRCIPKAWRYTRVMFISKPGKVSNTEAKAYRPISLSFFLLKTVEKLVDRYMRDDVMRDRPLH
jgi:hypothetical protein